VTSAFTSEDSELDEILRALSDLSKTFKSGAVDPVAVDATLKRAALWAVQKSLLDREVRSLAITDDLTGFFNRRGFLASVTQQLKLAHRDTRIRREFDCFPSKVAENPAFFSKVFSSVARFSQM